jgi:hypothetical protein
MKRIFTFITILFTAASAMAQMGGGSGGVVGRISGIVIDSITKKPMDYASVSIYRSNGRAPINGVLTDEKGSFKLNEVKSGKWKIVISFLGYPNKTIDPVITTPEKPDFNMGTVVIAPSGKALKAIEVSATKSVIETKIDKIVYNAEKDITSAGGNATDVMRKVPLVSVDINGNVSLRGDQNVRVLINGKPSGAMANNLADVLKSIPADQIKSVEVITSPSAKYDAEGSAGILNIITKNKNVSGVSGSISGGVGSRQNNGNANLNINQNRLSITGNFGGNATWPQTSHTQSGSFDSVNHKQSSTLASNKITRYGYRGSGSLSYDFNNFNSFTSNIAVNQGGFKAEGGSANTIIKNNNIATPTTFIYNGNNNSETTFGGFDWNNDYVHKFKKEGHQIDIAAQWSHGITDFSSLSEYVPFDATSAANTPKNLQSKNNGSNNEYTIQADYTLPVSDKFKIETGGKTIIRKINSVYNNYIPNSTGNYVFNDTTSNVYNYNQNVYAGYVVLTFTLPKNYGLQLGSRVENTDITGDPQNSLQSDLKSFGQNYTTYVPTLTLSKTINNQTFKLTYTKRIQRPSLTYLNPFENRSNSQNYSKGTPTLQPEITQVAELNYNTFIGASVINLSAYYKFTNNLIESIVSPHTDPNNAANTSITTFNNVGSNKSFGSSFFGSINPVKIVTIRGSINAYTYKPDPSGLFLKDQSQNGTYINYNAFLSASVNLKNGFAAESFVILNSPRRTIQGTNPSFSLYIIGVKKEFWDKKASIGLNTFSPFKEDIDFNTKINGNGISQFSNTQFPFRSFGISFSYAFGKVKFGDPNDPTQKKKKGVNNDDLKQGDQGNGPGR